MEITTYFNKLPYDNSIVMDMGEGKLQLEWARFQDYESYSNTEENMLITTFLSPTEAKKYALMFRNKQRQHEILITRIHAKNLIRSYLNDNYVLNLNNYLDLSVENQMDGETKGMPFINIKEKKLKDLKVSLTHSNEIVGAIVGERCLVGIDCEKVRNGGKNFLELFMDEDEIKWLSNTFEELDFEQKSMLMWCCKEAIGKAIGTGFSLGFSSIRISYDNKISLTKLKLDERLTKYITFMNANCNLYYNFFNGICKVVCVITDIG